MSVEPLALDYGTGDRIVFTIDGKIVDWLDLGVTRPNTPEERVRQVYARKLFYEYGYPKEHMVFGAPVNIGREARFADIVVYRDHLSAQQRDQGAARLIVETKAPNEKSGIGQLRSYILASSAEGGAWINASDAPKYLHRVNGDLREWPNLPRIDEAWEEIGQQTKAKLRPPHNLVETFKRCHNALYKQGIDSEDIAMDMVRIILAKYQDELGESDTPEFRCSPLDLQYAEGRKHVADRVRKLFEQVRDEHLDVFEPHEAITAGNREIATVVSELQDFRFLPEEDSDEAYDVVGAAYEVYIGSHLKGDRGQYFTHRLIVQLLTRIVDPDEKDTILDPAVGSGGFLIASMRHIGSKIAASHRSSGAKIALRRSVYGHLFGIDKSPKLVKVARTNMILASDGHSGLIHGDSLEPPDKLREAFLKKAGPGLPSVILTNPPFGATAEHRLTPEREPEVLAQFDVARTWRPNEDGILQPTTDFLTEGVPPEYLFVERCIRWVAPGGRVGIVVPRGLLDNDKAFPLRTMIFRETRVLAVVNCHDDTFKPHTDAKAALLVLERKTPQVALQEDDYPIFMGISQGIGHNGVGQPVYKTDANGDPVLVNGEPVLDQDTEDIYRAWEALRVGEPSPAEWYFRISRRRISPNLNLNPVRYLPRYTKSLQRVLELGQEPGWTVERLGQIADVFGGHRLKRPYADKGVTTGPDIVRFFTGNAVTQTRGENVKYLDLAKAKPGQLRMIEKMYLHRGMILITRSGTVGRVVYATEYHEGAVGTEDVIRVVVADDALRGYVYQFLSSKLGQDQLRANIYGAIVDHIEPDDVKGVQVPIPTDRTVLDNIGLPVVRSMELQERAYLELSESEALLKEHLDIEGDDARIRGYAEQVSRKPAVRERIREAAEHIKDGRPYPGAVTPAEIRDRAREG